MKIVYRIILFILICWFGYNAFRQTLGPQQAGLLDVFQYFNLVVLIILLVVAIASDTMAYRSYSKLFQFYSSIIGLLFCAVIFFRLISFHKIENAKTKFTVSTSAGSQSILSIQFKENNYLRIEEFNKLGQDIYYGRYYQVHDSIVITQTNYEKFSTLLPYMGVLQGNLLIWNKNDTMEINNKE